MIEARLRLRGPHLIATPAAAAAWRAAARSGGPGSEDERRWEVAKVRTHFEDGAEGFADAECERVRNMTPRTLL